MRKDLFIKKVLEQEKSFSEVEGYFYYSPVEHLLYGFFCEFTRGGIYIWRYTHPLFVESAINLNFAERWPHPSGYIDFSTVDKKSLDSEFLSRLITIKNQGLEQISSLKALKKYICQYATMLNNPNIRRVYAYLNVLLNKPSEAITQLNALLNQLEAIKNSPSLPIDFPIEEINDFQSTLKTDPEHAKNILLSWEKKNKALMCFN